MWRASYWWWQASLPATWRPRLSDPRPRKIDLSADAPGWVRLRTFRLGGLERLDLIEAFLLLVVPMAISFTIASGSGSE